jgi:hypothetical protein
MRSVIQRFCTGLAVFWILASPAFASSLTAQLQDPPSNNIVDNLYVGAYSFTNINDSSTFQMICDDFRDETSFNVSTYTVRSFDPNQLQGTLWGSSPNAGVLYQQAGWLAMGMTNQTGLTQGEYHFALWAIFDASDVLSYLKGFNNGKGMCNDIFGPNNNCNSTTISGGLLLQAQQNYGNFNYSNMMIVTPPCLGTKCAQQEFLMFSAPDGGSLLEYLGLTVTACLSTVLYSRKSSGLLKIH